MFQPFMLAAEVPEGLRGPSLMVATRTSFENTRTFTVALAEIFTSVITTIGAILTNINNNYARLPLFTTKASSAGTTVTSNLKAAGAETTLPYFEK